MRQQPTRRSPSIPRWSGFQSDSKPPATSSRTCGRRSTPWCRAARRAIRRNGARKAPAEAAGTLARLVDRTMRRACMTRPGTLGELRASGWVSRPVKTEIRENALKRIAAGEPMVEGILGFDDTVMPQLENALLAMHDVILLGERGQAKTRIIRGLVALLDEWMPIVGGSEVNDDPEHPISAHAKVLLAERRDE